MYYRKGMERRLRKGDVGEALFREWFERTLGSSFNSQGLTLEQQGYNPGGFRELSEKHLKVESDPDFAIYSKNREPLLGISINAQKGLYTVESAMGGNCIRCPRALSCADGKEGNLWYNKYNLSDYEKFGQRFNVEICMVSLLVNVGGIYRWVAKNSYENLVHAYIFDGGASLPVKKREKIKDIVHFMRHNGRKTWDRPMEVKFVLHSQLVEITPEKPNVQEGKIPFWTAGGRVERGRPRPVCCVDAKHARNEQALINYLTKLAK